MSRLIRGNLYDLSSDGLYRIVSASNTNIKTRLGMVSAFHNNLDADGKPYVGSLVVCRSSALGKADNTGVVIEAFSVRDTKKMGSYGQLTKVMSPYKKGEVSLLGNYDTIDFDDIEAYMNIVSDDYKKRMQFLENVSKTEKLKNSLIHSGKIYGEITHHADRIYDKLERPVPAMSFADIDVGHSLD